MTLNTMNALRLHGPGDLRLEAVPIPEPAPGEVLVKVHRCGICGTDLHIASGDFPAPNLPLTLGHEFSGTVAATSDTGDAVVGDRVVVDINIACGRCYFCRREQKLFCPEIAQLGVHRSGGLAEYVTAPSSSLHVLPESVSLDTAAYVEPLACAIHGQDRVGVRSGDTVLVIGSGPMGLAHIALSRLAGASQVIVSEPDSRRRALAGSLGADVALDPSSGELWAAIADLTEGRGADVVIEAVGSVRTYEDAFAAVRRGGRVLAYGAAPQEAAMSLSPFQIYAKELTIVGSYAGTYDTWPRAVELLAAGRFDPAPIVDTVQPLDAAVDTFRRLATDRSVVKAQIQL
jgi:2-desacetyl-2-hydroxyethyl bacteriochlorophyllide A dehydrogenase